MNQFYRICLSLSLLFFSAVIISCDSKKSTASNVFYRNLSAEPPTLNPISSSTVDATTVLNLVMESLAVRHDDTYEWVPALAESWEISKDGKEYTFKIRQGVKWHDGKPLTIEDVKFSYDVIFDPAYKTASLQPYYQGIESVEILDANTVKFKTKEKYFKNFDVAAGLSVVPKHIYGDSQKGSKLNWEVIGTGPYILSKVDRGKKLTLTQNENWWGRSVDFFKDQYRPKEIVFRYIKEENVELEMLKKGKIDFLGLTPEAYMKKTEGNEWGKSLVKVKGTNKAPMGYGFIGWNLRKPLFQSKTVRRALNYLMNRELMIEKFAFGMSLPATGPWHQLSEYADSDVEAIPFDPEKALELLKSEGWSDSDKNGVLDKMVDGKKVEFRFVLTNPSKDFEKYLTIFKEDAKQAGVDVDLRYMEWNSFTKLLDEQKFDAMALAWGAGSVDNDPKQIWHSESSVKGGSNFVGYNNPKVDQLIDKARKTLDKNKRIPILQEIYRTIADDAPYLFLFNRKFNLYAHTSKMKKPKDMFQYSIGVSYWWIEEPK